VFLASRSAPAFISICQGGRTRDEGNSWNTHGEVALIPRLSSVGCSNPTAVLGELPYRGDFLGGVLVVAFACDEEEWGIACGGAGGRGTSSRCEFVVLVCRQAGRQAGRLLGKPRVSPSLFRSFTSAVPAFMLSLCDGAGGVPSLCLVHACRLL